MGQKKRLKGASSENKGNPGSTKRMRVGCEEGFLLEGQSRTKNKGREAGMEQTT